MRSTLSCHVTAVRSRATLTVVRLRVLVVDDDDGALQALTRALVVHQGVEVTTATTEALALPVVSEVAFDAVIADLALEASPRGGLAVLEAVRREEAAQGRGRAELLLVTGGEDIAAANVAEDLGARFLHKPFAPEAITRLVDRTRARAVDLDEVVANEVAMLAEGVGLRGRDRETFVLMAAGLSSAEIQARMGIGFATERTYSNNVFSRLRERFAIELKNRHDLALFVRDSALRRPRGR